jgi:hypothetical protein
MAASTATVKHHARSSSSRRLGLRCNDLAQLLPRVPAQHHTALLCSCSQLLSGLRLVLLRLLVLVLRRVLCQICRQVYDLVIF